MNKVSSLEALQPDLVLNKSPKKPLTKQSLEFALKTILGDFQKENSYPSLPENKEIFY